MVQAQLGVELTLDYGGWTACRIMADRSDAELLCLHLLSNALRACSAGRQSAADAAPVRELLGS